MLQSAVSLINSVTYLAYKRIDHFGILDTNIPEVLQVQVQ